MATLDSDDLNAIEALLAPIEAKIDTVISSLTSIAGIVTDNNDMLDLIPTTAGDGGGTSFVASATSTAPFDPLFDIPHIAAEWDFSDRGTILRTATAQAKIGDSVDRVIDRVNGWPAILNGSGAVAPVVRQDGIEFITPFNSRLAVTDTDALDLIRNVPYAYVFCVSSQDVLAATQAMLRVGDVNNNRSRLFLYNNSSGRFNFDSVRVDGETQGGAFTAQSQPNGTKKIWYAGARWNDGIREARVNNSVIAETGLTYPTSGNVSDTRAAVFWIGGTGTTVNAFGSLNGIMHHVLLITPPAALTTGQIASYHAALAAKWGVTL
jgi:hypothetical protein